MRYVLAIVLFGLFLPFHSNAGWFSGPGKSDKQKVKLESGNGTCEKRNDGAFRVPFKILNSSNYTVNKIGYYIYAQAEGHSTKHIISFMGSDDLDAIVKAGDSAGFCFVVNASEIPTEEGKISYSADVRWVEFQDGDSAETVY